MLTRLTIIFLLLSSSTPRVIAQYEYPEEHFHSVVLEKEIPNVESYPKKISYRNSEQLTIQTAQKGFFTLTIIADFTMAYIWIYNDSGIEHFVTVEDSVYLLDLPSGTYSIFAGFAPTESQHTIILSDGIELHSPIQIRISRKDACFATRYQLIREDFSPLRINTTSFYFFNSVVNVWLRISHQNFDSTAFVFRYNKIPDYFKCEWAVKGKQLANQGNLYLLNNEFKDFGKDSVIINDPANFGWADFNYHLPDSVEQNYQIQIFTYIPDFHTAGIFDPYYNYPMLQRVYQDTSANIELNSSIFWQGLNAVNILYDFVNTSEIRIGQDKVNGSFYGERQAPSFAISENKNVQIGLTPAYWFGKFVNENDTIKIRSPYGRWVYLFLSQTNDVLRHYPIYYQLYRNNTIIQDGEFNLWFGPVTLRLGFDINDLTIPILPDKYKMVITDNQDEVAGLAGTSRVTAEFDLTLPDKNPPDIFLFQILSDGEIANVLNPTSNNLIRFRVEDDTEINSIQLFYSSTGDTIYHGLPVIYSEPYYQSNLPVLEENYYSLRLILKDASDNKIDCLMDPAFRSLGSAIITHNISDKEIRQIQLFPNYPNPFNLETTISFYVPPDFRGRVTLTIYNILGEEIKDYSRMEFFSGTNEIKWNGLDEKGRIVPSGIYLVKLKGGDFEQEKKILLIK